MYNRISIFHFADFKDQIDFQLFNIRQKIPKLNDDFIVEYENLIFKLIKKK